MDLRDYQQTDGEHETSGDLEDVRDKQTPVDPGRCVFMRRPLRLGKPSLPAKGSSSSEFACSNKFYQF